MQCAIHNQQMIYDDQRFKNLIGFSPTIFDTYVISPLRDPILQPRSGYRQREYKLPPAERIIRTIMITDLLRTCQQISLIFSKFASCYKSIFFE